MSFEYITPAIEKWKLNDFMEIIDRFEDVLADTTHHKMYVGNNYQTLLLHLAGASSVLARAGAGCGSAGDVTGAWLASAPGVQVHFMFRVMILRHCRMLNQ